MKNPVRPRQRGCPSLLGRDSRVRVKKRERADKKTAQLFLSLRPIYITFAQKLRGVLGNKFVKSEPISSFFKLVLMDGIFLYYFIQ